MDAILSNIQENFNFLISEMNGQHYDKIRFASYRTACKIRFIQKKTNLYLIDLFSAIEIIRENDLHKIQDINSELTVHQLYQMAQLLFLQLNKRLPRSQNIDITSSITNLLSFMIFANDVNQSGKINVLFTKIVFCTLSSGKFQEKLKYIFSQIIDPVTGNMMMVKFCALIKSLLQLACTVNESQFYQYDEQVAKTIFHTALLPSLDLKSFIRLFYSQNGPPPILSWFVIMHKMAQVEFVIHPTICSSCSTANFTGFRYKCLKCYNTNLCQNCFWTGKSTNSHNAEKHSCKEYLNYKSPSKQLGNSLKRSFRLKSSPKNKIEISDDFLKMSTNPNYDSNPPSSPFNQLQDFDAISELTYDNVECSLDGTNQFEVLPGEQQMLYLNSSPRMINELIANPQAQYIIIEHPQDAAWPVEQQAAHFVTDLNFGLDDEHRLISMYAASLANSNSLNSIVEGYDQFGNPVVHSITVDSHLSDQLNDAYLNQKLAECALDYENKNRELMMEIMRLQGGRDVSPSSDYNSLVHSVSNNLRSLSRFSNSPVLSIRSQQDAVAIEELCYLREQSSELDNHLQTLLMKKEQLKNQLQNTIKGENLRENLCSAPSSVNSTLNKKEAFAMQKDLNKLQKNAVKRDKMFEEIENLLEAEILQSHQNELDEEINKVQQEEQKLQEEKELLEDFDRILSVEEAASRLLNDKQQEASQTSQFNVNSNLSTNNLSTNDETTSDDSVTLHEELPGKQQQHNLYSGPTNYGPTNGERPQLNGGGGKQVEADNGISGLVEKTIDAYKNSSINQNESNNQIEFNEETMHNNILNRNIDLLLRQGKQQSSDQPAKANRINKYELVYGRRDKSSNPNSNLNSNLKNNLASNPGNNQTNPTRQYGQHSSVPLIRTTDGFSRMSNQSSFDSSGGGSDRQLTGRNPAASSGQFDKRTDARRDIRLLNDNSIEEISEANNSQTNSISSSSYLKFDVKGQPLMSFQSIAYVQANRLLNSNAPPHPGAQTSSLNKLMNLGSSNTSSDLPMYKMGESLDDSSLDSARIQDLCNLSSTSSNTESIKSSDTDDCPTLVDEMNNASFD